MKHRGHGEHGEDEWTQWTSVDIVDGAMQAPIQATAWTNGMMQPEQNEQKY